MKAFGAVMFFAFTASTLRAQGTYEIEVYSTELAPVKSLLIELHSNYTFRGSEVSVSGSHLPLIDDERLSATTATCTQTPYFQRVAAPAAQTIAFANSVCAQATIANSYAKHETIEAVTGLSSWSEVGAYLFTSEQASPVVRAVGGSVRVKVRAPAVWNWPVGVALSTELEYDDPRYANDPWSWELRPVIDKALGRWYFSVNPTLERTLRGTGVVNGVQLSPSAKANFDFTGMISGGVEYYGAYGRIGGFAPPDSRLQQIIGVVDLHLSPLWELNAGVGAGATPATNHLMAKLIVGRTFSWN